MLKQRIITALILLPIALCGFFLLEGSGFALFIGLVVSLGAWEWARLAGFTAQAFRVGFAAVVALMLFVMYILPGLAPWVLGASVLWWAVATWLVLTYPRSSGHWSSAASKLVIGLLILLPAWQGLVQIKQYPLGNWLILAVMVLVWGADIGAYFSGRAFGKRKLAPHVSLWRSGSESGDYRDCRPGARLDGGRVAQRADRRCIDRIHFGCG
jgi:phosphatidate cytidylyltransferase